MKHTGVFVNFYFTRNNQKVDIILILLQSENLYKQHTSVTLFQMCAVGMLSI